MESPNLLGDYGEEMLLHQGGAPLRVSISYSRGDRLVLGDRLLAAVRLPGRREQMLPHRFHDRSHQHLKQGIPGGRLESKVEV